MDFLTKNIFLDFANWYWGVPILIMLGGTGIILTIATGAVQFRHFGYAMKNTFGKDCFCKK